MEWGAKFQPLNPTGGNEIRELASIHKFTSGRKNIPKACRLILPGLYATAGSNWTISLGHFVQGLQ